MRKSKNSSFRLVFDFDGVIVDSEANVKKAYHEVGVIMPDDAWGKPWKSWLPDLVGSVERAEIVHNKKNVAYAEMNPVLLDGYDVFTRMAMRNWYQTRILTGASLEAVSAALPGYEDLAYTETTVDEKIRYLDRMATPYTPTLYIDDMQSAVDRVNDETNGFAKAILFEKNKTDLVEVIAEWMQ